MFSTILVTLDTSELGESVLPYVETIAKGLNSSITLFNAVDLSSLWWYGQGEEGDGFGDQSVLDELQSDAKDNACQYLDEKANQLETPIHEAAGKCRVTYLAWLQSNAHLQEGHT